MNTRLFIEKKQNFQIEKDELYSVLQTNFNLVDNSFRLLNIYDVFNIDQADLTQSLKSVFCEVMVDDVITNINFDNYSVIVSETLPGQYDQRADSSMQCIKLINPNSSCVITCGKLYLFDKNIDQNLLSKISNYLINPIENRVKDLNVLQVDENVEIKPLEVYDNFIDLNELELNVFLKNNSLAMSIQDLLLVQAYFKNEEKRNPLETEIKVLDTYWSDHCRHTTFETMLSSVKISTNKFETQIQATYDKYLQMRTELKRTEKPITLMDMATVNSRYLRSKNMLNDVEISDEINACSVFVDVDNNGVNEKWLMMFKNETHNHPTEIEPFGGASTCIGGAIRDPLSGRSYVYQAMRISGCGNVLQSMDQTLKSKLPQSVISKKACAGNSSYGNQIGLSTSFVKEIYHDSYVAKHLEVGAVVGACKASNVVRIKPCSGDVILLLGGRTGRDGIGGATGSSVEHNNSSLDTCASEVQKGNAPVERKIQRLFRNEKCTKLIKKCNDFGAGGVCVAIGELADGLIIRLDQVKVKYAGLNACEIAISESQERMAVVVAKEKEQLFISLCEAENLECYKVADVTDKNRLVMMMNDEVVCDMNRDFIETSGFRQSVDVEIVSNENVLNTVVEFNRANVLKTLSDKNVCSQKGLVENFDASIGAATVLMPFGGIYQATPTQASVHKFPVTSGTSDTASILTYGFNPKIFEFSPFLGSMYSVIDSMAKTVCVGGNYHDIYFSFQEYFERLNKNAQSWGKVCEALLGTINVLDYFDLAAIGGKDSMSGTFNDINVVPTLISFACSKGSAKKIISNELKGNKKLGVFVIECDTDNYPNMDSVKAIFDTVTSNIDSKNIVSANVVEDGGIIASLFKMSFGNKVKFNVDTELDLLKLYPSAIVVEYENEISSDYFYAIGTSGTENYVANNVEFNETEVFNAYNNTLIKLYPQTASVKYDKKIETLNYRTDKQFKATKLSDEVKVLIPVFPGTNCEYDTLRAFENEGAVGHIFIFRNLNTESFNQSVKEFAQLIIDTNILVIPGGFSAGDEPDGSAKFIVNILNNATIKAAINKLIENDGLILGICNGFQALIKCGLLPYGDICDLDENCPTLYRNDISRHISCIAHTVSSSNNSPWLSSFNENESFEVAMSHGEGKFIASDEVINELIKNGQVAFQYCNLEHKATMDNDYNINGSCYAIEGITSKCGHILGKMGHSERYHENVFKNIYGNKQQNIFANGVNYFRKGK